MAPEDTGTSPRRRLPSVDEVLKSPHVTAALARHGRWALVEAVRAAIADFRAKGEGADAGQAASAAAVILDHADRPRLRAVHNLTGTILHTNLGRALLAEVAIEAATNAMRSAVALEYDLATGKRGERDDIVRELLCKLTGAEDATVVNNNAAAVMLCLNAVGAGRETIVSRGELIEIGGAFRMPDIMARAGTILVEIGTTNRTHTKDYVGAIGERTALLMKVHTSNYRIQGFTKEVGPREVAEIAHARGLPMLNDLGSGTLIDLDGYGLAHEPTVAEAVAEGADLVTFSGDKLLGGPQTGFIVGKKALLEKINRNPMKRALRVDKMRLAALEATLRLYLNPEKLAERLPTMRLIARPVADIATVAARIVAAIAPVLGQRFAVAAIECESQVGSGAMPLSVLKSAGLSIKGMDAKTNGRLLGDLAAALRDLPVPVIGRLDDGALVLDCRCLEDEAAFVANFAKLDLSGAA
jgi:L-seryl-tRNA(Ser) seleniumtransferase